MKGSVSAWQGPSFTVPSTVPRYPLTNHPCGYSVHVLRLEGAQTSSGKCPCYAFVLLQSEPLSWNYERGN